MRQLFRALALTAAAAGILVFPLGAGAGHTTDPHSPDLVPRGHILEPASLLNPAIGNPDIHTDIAFWGKFAIQGNWDGFNIRDISDPDNPKQVGRAFCNGDQGDVVVFKNLVVRSWNSNAPGTTTCGGEPCRPGSRGCTSSTSATRPARSSWARSTCPAARTRPRESRTGRTSACSSTTATPARRARG